MSKQTHLPQLTYTPSRLIYTGDRITGQARAYWQLNAQFNDEIGISVRITHDYCDTLKQQVTYWYHRDGDEIRGVSDGEYQTMLESVEQHEGPEAVQPWIDKHACITVLPTLGARAFGWPTIDHDLFQDLISRWNALKLLVSPSVCI